MIVFIIGVLLVALVLGLISRNKGDSFMDTLGSGCGTIIFFVIAGIIAIIYFANSSSDTASNSSDSATPKSENETKESRNERNESKSIKFNNNTSSKIYISTSYLSGGSWITRGWSPVNSRESYIYSLPQNIDRNSVYWYAYNSDFEWEGNDKNFIVDKDSEDGFKVVDGSVVKDGNGTKMEKGFKLLQLESEMTECNFSE